MKVLLDKWVAKYPFHKTTYYLYNDGHKYDICVSVAEQLNGEKTYCMSDTRNPLRLRGTQRSIKKIIDELENESVVSTGN